MKKTEIIGKEGEIYKAIRKSYGFRKKIWTKGDTFVAKEGEIIPYHFERIGQAKRTIQVSPEDRELFNALKKRWNHKQLLALCQPGSQIPLAGIISPEDTYEEMLLKIIEARATEVLLS